MSAATFFLYRARSHERVALPADLRTFRGEAVRVERIAVTPIPGKSGKVELSNGRVVYPGVVDCYIATAPRSDDAA